MQPFCEIRLIHRSSPRAQENKKKTLKSFNNNPSNSYNIFISEALTKRRSTFMHNYANFAKIELFILVGPLNANSLLKQPNTTGKSSLIINNDNDLARLSCRDSMLPDVSQDVSCSPAVYQLICRDQGDACFVLSLCLYMLAVRPRIFFVSIFLFP